MVGSTRDELIKQYFNIGFSYKEILVFLSTRHNISLSLRQLKRVLKNTNLSTRKSRSTINSVMQFINNFHQLFWLSSHAPETCDEWLCSGSRYRSAGPQIA